MRFRDKQVNIALSKESRSLSVIGFSIQFFQNKPERMRSAYSYSIALSHPYFSNRVKALVAKYSAASIKAVSSTVNSG